MDLRVHAESSVGRLDEATVRGTGIGRSRGWIAEEKVKSVE